MTESISLGDILNDINGLRDAGILIGASQPGSPHEHLDIVAVDAKKELVDFVLHRLFYPVLMTDRAWPNKATIGQVQDATRAEIDRYRRLGSVEEVIANFQHDLRTGPAKDIYSALKCLRLPVNDNLQDEFILKVRELGYELEISPHFSSLSSNTGDRSMDQERIRQRAHSIWERTGKPDGAHDEHWQQACREIEAEDGTMPAPPSQAEMTAEIQHLLIE